MKTLDFNRGWNFSCPDGRSSNVTLPHDAMLNTERSKEPGFTWFLLAGWQGNDYTYTKTWPAENAVYCRTPFEPCR